MPGSHFVPANLEDLVGDVVIVSAAQGDILYRSGSGTWANLPTGTAGRVLTSGGAGANPSWAAVSAGVTSFNTRPGAITLTTADVDAALPADVAQTDVANTFTVGPQTIQTGADGNVGLVVKGNSPTQSGSLQEWQDSSSVVRAAIDSAGHIIAKVDSNGTAAVYLGDTSSGFEYAGYLSVKIQGTVVYVHFQDLFDMRKPVRIQNGGNGSSQALGVGVSDATQKGLIVQGAPSQSAVPVQLHGQSSLQAREQADLDTAWVDSTDATRKARVLLRAWDTTAREGLRIEADGANALIGFLGANAVSRPTVTGSRGGNAALASLLGALASLGLITDSTTA